MAPHNDRPPGLEAGRGLRLAITVGVCGVAATVALFAWLWTEADRYAAARLETHLESVLESSEHALAEVGDKLVSMGGLFRSSVVVTHDEFQTFTSDIGLLPGVTALGYVAHVEPGEITPFERRLKAVHGESVGVFQLDEDLAPMQLEERPQHFIVEYVMPLDAWSSVVGYDVASDPKVAETITEAAETGQLRMTPFFRISTEASDTSAMLLPVSQPASDDLDGFVGAIIGFEELLSSNIPAGVSPHISLDYQEGIKEDEPERLEGHLEYGGQMWTLSIQAVPGSPFAPDRSGALAVLMIGLVASALGGLLAFIAREHIETRTLLAAAQQATEAKDRFIASVSHELRTPLTAVLGFAEILKTPEGLTTEERFAMMKAITEEATDLAHLIDDLLVAARGEIGRLFIVKTPVDLRREVEGVVAASGIGERVQVVIPEDGSEIALGDPIRVRQIVRNLVENARRYGGDTIEVEVLPGHVDVGIEVRDNGQGIPAEVGEKAFARFVGSAEALGLTESLGLGLAVCAQLAQLMQGRLSYERRNAWSVFTLTLPAARSTQLDRPRSSVSRA